MAKGSGQPLRNGFTLVEMMAAMLAGAVLALTAGAMLVFGYAGWANHADSVKMQDDASLAMLVIGREIRESNMADIGYSGKGLSFAPNAVRSNATAIVVSDSQLVVQPGGFVLVEDWVNGFTARMNGASVDITLHLRGGRRMNETTLNASFTPRN